MRLPSLVAVTALASLSAWADLPLEVQLATQALRSGERARLEKALGPVERLPLYRIELEVDAAGHLVKGRESLTLTASRELDHVVLRLTPNATGGPLVRVTQLEVDGVAQATVEGDEPALVPVRFSKPLSKGQAATITLRFTARVPPLRSAGGEAGGDYGAYSSSPDVISLPGLVPMLSPFKANGEPADLPTGIGDLGTFDPSNFIVGVIAPSGWRALAPGVLTGEVQERAGRRFTYAVAGARELPVLLVKGYDVVTRQVGETTVEAWASHHDAKSNAAVLEHAGASLEQLEAHLGPYPYTTLRVVETHLRDGAGGMEFPGLVTVSSTLYGGAVNPLAALGVDLAGDPALQQLLGSLEGLGNLGEELHHLFEATLEFTVEHELAHQYFAMLVGNDPIAAPVVDEPLTQHVALLLMEWRHGRGIADEMRTAQLKASYQLLRMMGGPDGVANRPTSAFKSNAEYAALIYGKAPLMFDAWRKELGDEQWLSILKGYVATSRYGWATPRTLLTYASKRAPRAASTLEGLQRRWWDERHGDEDVGAVAGDLGGLGDLSQGLPPGVDPKQAQEALDELLRQFEQ